MGGEPNVITPLPRILGRLPKSVWVQMSGRVAAPHLSPKESIISFAMLSQHEVDTSIEQHGAGDELMTRVRRRIRLEATAGEQWKSYCIGGLSQPDRQLAAIWYIVEHVVAVCEHEEPKSSTSRVHRTSSPVRSGWLVLAASLG